MLQLLQLLLNEHPKVFSIVFDLEDLLNLLDPLLNENLILIVIDL